MFKSCWCACCAIHFVHKTMSCFSPNSIISHDALRCGKKFIGLYFGSNSLVKPDQDWFIMKYSNMNLRRMGQMGYSSFSVLLRVQEMIQFLFFCTWWWLAKGVSCAAKQTPCCAASRPKETSRGRLSAKSSRCSKSRCAWGLSTEGIGT